MFICVSACHVTFADHVKHYLTYPASFVTQQYLKYHQPANSTCPPTIMSPPPRPTHSDPPPGAFICYPSSSRLSYQPNLPVVDHFRFSSHPGMELVLRDDLQARSHSANSRTTTDNASLTSTWRAESGTSSLSALQGPLDHTPSLINLPFGAVTRGGSDFTVHYVCCECQRPRSVRYHNEHPIPLGVPVPISSSICHRCQNTSDNRITEIFEENEPAIGTKDEKKQPSFTASEKNTKGSKEKSKKR